MVNMVKLQIGKQGLTPEFIENLKINFKNVENIRVSVLKSACRDKEEFKKMAEDLVSQLGQKFTKTTLGYTIILKKWRKARQ